MTVDPDWAMFNLAAFSNSWYGKDFVDCKSIAIHIWYFGLAKIVGKSVARVRFAHHFIIGAASIPIYLLSQNFLVAFVFLILIQSGWMFAFHGNVGQHPAVFIMAAMYLPKAEAAYLWAMAVAFEPKLVLSFIAWAFINNAIIESAIWSAIVVALLVIASGYKEFIEANITIPGLMRKNRALIWKELLTMNYTGSMYTSILPWVAFAVIGKPDVLYWLPAILFTVVTYLGLAVRPNHLIPIIPWIAFAISPEAAIALIIVDIVSAEFYMGDIWKRFYLGLADLNDEAKQIGLWLKDKAGSLRVNDLHTAIHIYSEKPVCYGMAEQIEIREVADKRRKAMLQLWKDNPARWVVDGSNRAIPFTGKGYMLAAESSTFKVYKKIGE